MTTIGAVHNGAPPRHGHMYGLMLGALGVVYGDIGTSPLYAMKQSLVEVGEGLSEANVLGVLSLIAWSLTLVVTVKYVVFILRADNRGEGGILALTALAQRASGRGIGRRRFHWIMAAGMAGAALFYGDGIITPAISVLSAVEGLKVATPFFEPYVVPISLGLIIALFAVQRRGTARVGRAFGPIMVAWFAVLALLGLIEIAKNPHILLALNPYYGVALLAHAPWRGFVLLGAVVLAVTGAEALYADIGHFGPLPIRRVWLYFVFPALLINYFGQGALVLADPAAIENPFYLLAPKWSLYPMVILSSVATIIASQAVITGAFSITRQAVQLGYLPRFQVLHTSEQEIGQVYLPKVNSALLLAIIVLIVGFKSSDNLGAAYGIAVTGTMAITTALAYVYFHYKLKWNVWIAAPVFGFFLLVDLLFFAANLLKFVEGGWFPLAVAVGLVTVMATWWRGRRILERERSRDAMPLKVFLDSLNPARARIPGTAIFMTRNISEVPRALLHALKHFKGLHERVALMTVQTADVPHVPEEQRLELKDVGKGFYTMTVHYGFMDEPNVLRVLALARSDHRMHFNMMETSVIVGREKVLTVKRTGYPQWFKRLFALMNNLALDATEFFKIPPNRVVELGGQIEI